MTLFEANEALGVTLEDIAKILTDAGLYAKATHGLMGVDFEKTDAVPDTALIYGEIAFGEGDDNKCGLLECAVSAVEGEVAPEELRRELYDMRAEAKRIAEAKASLSEGETLFEKLNEETEEENDEQNEELDNPNAENSGIAKYIGIGIFVAIAIFTLVLLFIR